MKGVRCSHNASGGRGSDVVSVRSGLKMYELMGRVDKRLGVSSPISSAR